ncbi:hypothetical protein M5689_009260 [Euphorbia peplus]|nr:hypothetical protein M5689_009260 [Euphorbia peplus]
MSSAGEIPGDATSTTVNMVDKAAGAVQSFAPLNKIHEHLCAFHYYGNDMSRQLEAHHYCAHQNEKVRQCVIYDSPEADAKLIGVEYIISEDLFIGLEDEEKRYWHSHEYEVKSGILFLPGLPESIQRKGLEPVAKTYGKTFHFWQVDKGDALPLGIPQPMLSLTKDNQLDEKLAQDVQKRYDISYAKEREQRTYMKGPDNGIHALADGAGKGIKTVLKETLEIPWRIVPALFSWRNQTLEISSMKDYTTFSCKNHLLRILFSDDK